MSKSRPSKENDSVNSHPAGGFGTTSGVGVASGLSSHRAINSSADSLGQGHAQGERPKMPKSETITHGGRTFKTK